MTSLPSSSVHRPRWYRSISWKITQPFEVKWISKMHCDDGPLLHIKNPLNDGMPVMRARDCQEVEENAGREMIRIINREANKEMKDED
jgi:YTH domain-containing protein 1